MIMQKKVCKHMVSVEREEFDLISGKQGKYLLFVKEF